jgi:hypothetical protein
MIYHPPQLTLFILAARQSSAKASEAFRRRIEAGLSGVMAPGPGCAYDHTEVVLDAAVGQEPLDDHDAKWHRRGASVCLSLPEFHVRVADQMEGRFYHR